MVYLKISDFLYQSDGRLKTKIKELMIAQRSAINNNRCLWSISTRRHHEPSKELSSKPLMSAQQWRFNMEPSDSKWTILTNCTSLAKG